jgi:phage-related protein
MPATFNWTDQRQAGATGNNKFRVRKSQFGDGYKQLVKDGLNNKERKWPLSFKGDLDYLQPIIDFLDDHEGAVAFVWTPPGGAQGLFTAEAYSLNSIGGGLYSLSTELEESFAP